MAKSHKYPLFERAFFNDCLQFLQTTCPGKCFCRSIKNNGAWVIREDLDFNDFLSHFVNLWARGSKNIVDSVHAKHRVTGRYSHAVAALITLSHNWKNWNNTGQSLPKIINKHRKTIVCQNSFEDISPIINEIVDLCAHDTTGVYTSKIISQLFPDIAIPFDTKSKQKMRSNGYDPARYGNGLVKNHAINFIIAHQLNMQQFRGLDNAPRSHWNGTPLPVGDLTSCSRVIDKLFY